MPPKNSLGEFEQMILLAVMQKAEEAYGVEVRREIEAATGKKITRGAFYTSLDRLKAKGFLDWELKAVENVRGGHPQRYFAVTGAGREQLRRAREAMNQLWSGLEDTVTP
jgi:PadR family transcriptional regulator